MNNNGGDGTREQERPPGRGVMIGMLFAFILFVLSVWFSVHVLGCNPGAGLRVIPQGPTYEDVLFRRNPQK